MEICLLLLAVAALFGFAGFLVGELHGMGYYWPSVLEASRKREELRAQLADLESPEWRDGGGI